MMRLHAMVHHATLHHAMVRLHAVAHHAMVHHHATAHHATAHHHATVVRRNVLPSVEPEHQNFHRVFQDS